MLQATPRWSRKITSVMQTSHSVTLGSIYGTLRICAVDTHILRITFAQKDAFSENPLPFFVENPPIAAKEILAGEDETLFAAGGLSAKVCMADGSLAFYTPDGTLLFREGGLRTLEAFAAQRIARNEQVLAEEVDTADGKKHVVREARREAYKTLYRARLPLAFAGDEAPGLQIVGVWTGRWYVFELIKDSSRAQGGTCMKKGLNAWTYPDSIPMEKRVELAVKAGYDGFEFLYEKEGYVSMATPDARLREIRRMTEDQGLVIPSLVGIHYEGLSMASGDAKEAGEAVERAKRALHAGSVLGADTLLLVVGGCSSTTQDPWGQYDMVYENGLKNLRILARTAVEEGIRIGVEPVWNKFLLSPLEMRHFVDAVESPSVGVYFDTGNVMIWSYPEQWIRILGKRIFKCHFKDFRRSVGNGGGFVDLLAGDVDFPQVMAAFREVGYDDFCTCETSYYPYDAEFSAIQTASAMNRIFRM